MSGSNLFVSCSKSIQALGGGRPLLVLSLVKAYNEYQYSGPRILV